MTLFLRTSDNRTIVDIEATDKDLHVVICIGEYSRLLLMIDPALQQEFIEDFRHVQELRGVWFEKLRLDQWYRYTYSSREFAQLVLTRLAFKYNLSFVVD